MEILRFSEIFGIHEPLRKGERREHRHSVTRGIYLDIVNLYVDFVCKCWNLLSSSRRSLIWKTEIVGSTISDVCNLALVRFEWQDDILSLYLSSWLLS